MKLFFASLLCMALLVGGGGAAFSQTATGTAPADASACPAGTTFVKGYTKKNGTAVAAHCKAGKKTSSSAMSPAAPAAMTTPAQMKTTTSASGTTATTTFTKGSASSMSSSTAPEPGTTACPAGKSYVHGYTRKDGKTVAGYCRKSPAKKS